MDNFYEHIDDYKNGLLKDEALTQFEAELNQNDSLRIAVDNYDAAKSISEGLLEVDMMETLKDIASGKFGTIKDGDSSIIQAPDPKKIIDPKSSSDRSSEKINLSVDNTIRSKIPITETKIKRFKYRRLAIAASFIGILALGSWWIMAYNTNQEHIAYVQNNYVKPVDDDATKSVDTVGMTPFEKGKYLFGLNKYGESEKWLLIALEKETDKKFQPEGHYWLGSAHIMQGDVGNARKSWEESDDERAKKSLEILRDGKKR